MFLFIFDQYHLLALTISCWISFIVAKKIRFCLGFTAIMSSHTQKMMAPNFLAHEMAYLALFIFSSSSAPFMTISQLTALGSILAHM